MKSNKNLFYRQPVLLCISLIGLVLSGCQNAQVKETVLEPVFYPPLASQPRMQFLASFTGGEDFDVPDTGFLETFVLGAPEIQANNIQKPYGVAIYDGKIYVCDVGQRRVKVLDLVNQTFTDFPLGRPLKNPIGIFIENDGTKYIADSKGGAVFVYNQADKLIAIHGRELDIKPKDVCVFGDQLYLADDNYQQVLVLNKKSGELIQKIGRKLVDKAQWAPDEFAFINNLTTDQHGNVYVSDKLKGMVGMFDASGEFIKNFGRPGSSPASLVRAKGLAVDREQRLWAVDAGPATAVKIFRPEDGRLLMFFGTLGKDRGYMYLPADICIDYDNVALFKDYAVEGAELEFIVLVTNQYGPHKVSVYGFGRFPEVPLMGADATEPQETPEP